MADYETKIVSVMVVPIGEPIFSELATTITVENEGAGEFLVVSQHGRDGMSKISIDRVEWPALRSEIDKMMGVLSDG